MTDPAPWIAFAERRNAKMHQFWPGGMPRLLLRAGHAILSIDAPASDGLGYGTRIRSIHADDSIFTFVIRRMAVFGELLRWFRGGSVLQTGDRSFDRKFTCSANNVPKLRAVIADPELRAHISRFPSLSISRRSLGRWNTGYLSGDPSALSALDFRAGRVLTPEEVDGALDLFHELLAALERVERAGRDEVEWLVQRLRVRGGSMSEAGIEIWNGDAPRREAAARLGALGDVRAVEVLIEVLEDDDVELRAAAMNALGGLGDARAVGPLLASLGDRRRAAGRLLSDHAGRALRALDAGELTDAFHRALQGDSGPLRQIVGEQVSHVARALIGVMQGSDLFAVEAAGRTLDQLGAMETLSDLRRIQDTTGWDRTREACRATIDGLEARASLPRPARPAGTDVHALPRTASEPAPDTTGLPRPADPE